METDTIVSLLGENTPQLMRVIVEKAPIGIYTINKEGIIDFANKKFLDISGDSEKQLLGLNALTLPTYQQFGLVQHFIDGLQGKPFETEAHYVAYVSGKESYRHYIGEPIRAANGEVERLLLLVEDITERKKLEVELEKSFIDLQNRTKTIQEEQARLYASIESVTLGYIITSSNKQINSINKAAKTLLHLAADNDITFDKVVACLHDCCDLNALFTQCLSTNKMNKLEAIKYNEHFLKLQLYPISVENTCIGVVILLEDTTEEENLKLEKDEFFSIASHELRTPLTAIMGYTSLMQQYENQLPKEDIENMVTNIHQSSKRLINIVNDFLDMSRLELGKIQFTLSTFDIVELTKKVVEEYNVSGVAHNLSITLSPPQTAIPQVYADADRVKQVLINLIGNALKFTKEGGITLSLQSDNQHAKILVQDTGIGIAPNDQQKLFKKFLQISSTLYTRDSSKGSGLGLYISQLIMNAMNGSVLLESSEQGKGSIFSIKVPLAKQ